MAKESGGRLPGGMGGLVQYYDEYDEPFQISPEAMVAFIALFISIELLAHWQMAGI